MTLMFVGFGLYFLYDGFIGYPKKNKIYDAHQRFEEIQEERKTFLESGKTSADWKVIAQEKGYPDQEEWIDYAAENGWPEKPPEKRYSTTDQFVCGALCIAVGLAILGTMMINRSKILRADAESFTTPNGQRVRFASARKVDKRKWDNKGLCYVHYEEDGKTKRAVIDDLKFAGADKILDRLMANFEGQLIERVVNEPNDSDKSGPETAQEQGSPSA